MLLFSSWAFFSNLGPKIANLCQMIFKRKTCLNLIFYSENLFAKSGEFLFFFFCNFVDIFFIQIVYKMNS